jgi:hypothetical protein
MKITNGPQAKDSVIRLCNATLSANEWKLCKEKQLGNSAFFAGFGVVFFLPI